MRDIETLNSIVDYENHAFLAKQDEKIQTAPEDLKEADKQKIQDYLANNWYSAEDAIYAEEILTRWPMV